MFSQTLSLFSSMYEAVGPGLFLAAAFPVLLVVFGVVLGVGLKRFARRGGAA